jgi:hypothetical protein
MEGVEEEGGRKRRLPNSGSFVKGDPRIRPLKEKAERELEQSLVALEAEPEAMLAVMRHVSTRPPAADTTYQQKEFRKWLREHRAVFMAKLADLEAKFAAPEAREAAEAVDRGAERSLALVEQLLEEVEATVRGG